MKTSTTSTYPTTSSSRGNNFKEKDFSLAKNSKNYGNTLLSLLQQEDGAQESSSLMKQVNFLLQLG